MPKYYKNCAVFGCSPGFSSPNKQYSFPKNIELRKKWIKLVSRKPLNPNYATVCSRHFSNKQKTRNLQHELLNYTPRSYRDLREDAVPDLNLPQFKHSVDEYNISGEHQSSSPQHETAKNITKGECPEKNEVTPEKLSAAAQLTNRHKLPPTSTAPQACNISSSGQKQSLLTVAVPQTSTVTSSMQHQQQPLLTFTAPQTSAITSTIQHPFLTLPVPQTSTLTSSVQQQPFLTLAVPQTSAISSSIQQQPLLAVGMPQNFTYPPSLPNPVLSQLAPTQPSTFLPSIQQQSILNLSNPQLLSSYLSLLQHQNMLKLPIPQKPAGQSSPMLPQLLLPSTHSLTGSALPATEAAQQLLAVNALLTNEPSLEDAKEPEFVQVKEEPEEFSPECSDNDIKSESAIILPDSSSGSAVKDEALEDPVGISSDKMNEDDHAHSPFCASEDASQQALEDVTTRPASDNEFHRQDNGPDGGDQLGCPAVEVKVEIKENGGDVRLTSDHKLESQPFSEAEDDLLEDQPEDHSRSRDLGQRALSKDAAEPTTADQQDASPAWMSKPETQESSLTDPDLTSVVALPHSAMDTDQSSNAQLKEDHYSCAKCNFTSNTQCHLKQHLLTAHSNHKYYKCDQCSYVTRQPNSLKKHISSLHQNQKLFKCELCSYETISKRASQVHSMVKHSENRPFKCTQCEYASVYSSHLKRHVTAIHPGPYREKCDHCGFVAMRELAFRNHLLTMHPDQEKYECTQCVFTTQRPHKLQKHFMAKHPTENPYKCDRCDYGTEWSHLLKQHMLSEHPVEKVFKCAHCEYTTTIPQHYKRHVSEVHLGVKVYKCDQCDYESSTLSVLKIHRVVGHLGLKPHSDTSVTTTRRDCTTVEST